MCSLIRRSNYVSMATETSRKISDNFSRAAVAGLPVLPTDRPCRSKPKVSSPSSQKPVIGYDPETVQADTETAGHVRALSFFCDVTDLALGRSPIQGRNHTAYLSGYMK